MTSAARDAPAAAPRRSALAQAGVTAIAGTITFVVGSLLYALVTDGLTSGSLSLRLLPPPIAWSILVLALGALVRRIGATALAWCAIALAPAASLLALVLDAGWEIVPILPSMLWIVAWQSAGMVGAAVIGAVVGREWRSLNFRTRGLVTGASVLLLAAGAATAFALPLQFVHVYFRLGGEAATVTPEQGDRYLRTMVIALALLGGAVVAAAFSRRRWLVWLTAVALVLGGLGAFALQVPQGRFTPPREAPAPLRTGDIPCYGEGPGCEGG